MTMVATIKTCSTAAQAGTFCIAPPKTRSIPAKAATLTTVLKNKLTVVGAPV